MITGSPRLWFITFGDGSFQFRQAARRLAKQAAGCGLFDVVQCHDLISLKHRLGQDWSLHKSFILDPKNRRGLGFWLWKPLLVNGVLKEMPPGDILVYCDAGCELDLQKIDAFKELVKKLRSFDAVFYKRKAPIKEWTNEKTIRTLNVNEHELEQPQIIATSFILKKCANVVSLIETWVQYCTKDNSDLLIDRSDTLESAYFKEHRHDQSLLAISTLKAAESNFLNACILPVHSIAKKNRSFIIAARNRTGIEQKYHEHKLKWLYLKWIIWKAEDMFSKILPLDKIHLWRVER